MKSVIVGRGSAADLVLRRQSISKQHCRFDLAPRGQGMSVTDLNSRNGTFLDGHRLKSMTSVQVPKNAKVTLADGIVVDLQRIYRMLRKKTGAPSRGRRTIERRQQETSQEPVSAPRMRLEESAGAIVIDNSRHGSEAADMMKVIESGKSYVGKAWLAFLLYFVGFYVVGLIFNIVWLGEANHTKQVVGRASGHGCLIALLVFFLVIPAVFIVLALTTSSSLLFW